MSIIIAFISSIMSALADIFWKKSLAFPVGKYAHMLAAYLIAIILFIIVFWIEGGLLLSIWVAIFVFIDVCITLITTNLRQALYKIEKISVIMPYTNLRKVVMIVGSFFIFSDVSYLSLAITIAAIAVVVIASIDFKSHSVPKNFLVIFIMEFLHGATALLGGWVVLKYGDIAYFMWYVMIGLIVTTSFAHLNHQLSDLKRQPKTFWIPRLLGGMGWIGWLLSLVVIKELGFSVSVLLGFLGIGITLLFAYILLGDKPTKKDLLTTVIVSILVGIGFYFK